MRNLYLISILILLNISCQQDYLSVLPEDQLTDEVFWKSESDAELALTALYSGWESYWDIMWWDLMTDNGYSQFPWDGVQVIGNGEVNPSNTGRQYFDYGQIRKCNKFLENIDLIDMDDERKEIYKAEARFLRAYDYFVKVQFYGDVPLITDVIDDAEEAKVSRDSKDAVVNFILSELDEVSSILPVENMRQSDQHVTSGSALALKARLELYEKNYTDAMADAKSVINMSVYELFPDYRGLFLEDNEDQNTESILEISYIENLYSNRLWQHLTPAKEGGWSSISAVQNFVDSYEMEDGKTIDDKGSGYDPENPFKNRDPRLDNTIIYPGVWFHDRYFNSLDETSPDFYQIAAAPRSGYNVKKYLKIVPGELLNNGGENIIVIRLAEMYLTFAEAAIESDNINDEIYEAINIVRRRAGMPDVDRSFYNSQEKLRELIRRERRVELAFEGLRYWDIKRWDIGSEVMDGPLYGSRKGSVNDENGNVKWEEEKIKLEERNFYPERNYLLPIPQSELDANPNIEQNPGY